MCQQYMYVDKYGPYSYDLILDNDQNVSNDNADCNIVGALRKIFLISGQSDHW